MKPRQSPEEWAAEVRQAYAFDATDDQLVTLAEACVKRAHDPAASVTAQFAAMREFRATVKQLALVARNAAAAATTVEEPKPPRRERPRTGADPRLLLMAVNNRKASS